MLLHSDAYDLTEEYSDSHDSVMVYGPLPPGAAHAVTQESGHDTIVIAPGTYSLSGAAAGPSVVEWLAALKPETSNPRLRAISTASHKMGDTTRLWLDKKVKEPTDEDGTAGEGTDAGVAY